MDGAPEAVECEDRRPQMEARAGFDSTMAGKRAECDGGDAVAGTRLGGRQEFAGTLTGEYIDHGDPPWRWYLMVGLTHKPAGYGWDSVWCEAGSVFLVNA